MEPGPIIDRNCNGRPLIDSRNVTEQGTRGMFFSSIRVARLASYALFVVLLYLGGPTRATVVRFETSLGNFDIRLFDSATPLTAQNLLAYINANRYDGTFIHRSVPGFVIQGGGYFYNTTNNTAPHITTFPQILNEPDFSNIRGTLAMAKLGDNPNSATSEWFPNLSHNTDNLDNQNEGFTVFASVLGNGMQVIDAIAALPRFDVDGALETFNTVPLRTGTSLANRLVFINDVYALNLPAGDFNRDGTVDNLDLAVWQEDYGRVRFQGGDFNDDKEIDSADLAIWSAKYGMFKPSMGTIAKYTDGDTDGDGDVDGRDLLNLQRGLGGTTDVSADANGNGQVDGDDFLIWQRTFGQTAPLISSLATVPEPSALLLALGITSVLLPLRVSTLAACGLAPQHKIPRD